MDTYYNVAGKRYPFNKVDVKLYGNIRQAIQEYKKAKSSVNRLFLDYLSFRKFSLKNRNSSFEELSYKKGDAYIRGINIDEELFEKYAWDVRKIDAPTLIKALFYDGANNESAYECGFEYSMILNNDQNNTYLLDPSPFLIEKLRNECKGFIVQENYKEAYFKSYRTGDKFVSHKEVESIKEIGINVVGIIRDEIDERNIYALMDSNKPKNLVLTISIAQFHKCRHDFINNLHKSGLQISQIVFLDNRMFEKNPKKRIVLYINNNGVDSIPCFKASLEKDEIVIDDKPVFIDENYLASKVISYKEIKKSNETRTIVERTHSRVYKFSEEIHLNYTKINRNNNRNSLAVSYYSHPDDSGKQHRLIDRYEKGMRYENESEINEKLIGFLFKDEVFEIVSKDIRSKYNDLSVLSIKTLWYINRSRLLLNKDYNDDLCRNIFISEDKRRACLFCSDFLSDEKNSVACLFDINERLTKKAEDDIKIIRQLYIVFSLFVVEKYIKINPFRLLYEECSARMSVEQYEVRNALTKKHLTIEEQRQLTKQFESASELEIIIILFRLFTAIPVKEMLAIRYGEINKIKDYGFYQVDIVKVIDKDGQHRVFGEKNDWNRYRKIPLINELGLFIEKRKQAWMKRYNLSEKQINKIPVFCESYDGRRKDQIIIDYEFVNKMCRKAIADLDIPILEVNLPGDKDIITDLNKYYSDIFISNFKYHANHTSMMNMGQINYLLGLNAPDTFSKHYCDFTNDAIQYLMYVMLSRWSTIVLSENVINNSARINVEEFNVINTPQKFRVHIDNQNGCIVKIVKQKGDNNEKENK